MTWDMASAVQDRGFSSGKKRFLAFLGGVDNISGLASGPAKKVRSLLAGFIGTVIATSTIFSAFVPSNGVMDPYVSYQEKIGTQKFTNISVEIHRLSEHKRDLDYANLKLASTLQKGDVGAVNAYFLAVESEECLMALKQQLVRIYNLSGDLSNSEELFAAIHEENKGIRQLESTLVEIKNESSTGHFSTGLSERFTLEARTILTNPTSVIARILNDSANHYVSAGISYINSETRDYLIWYKSLKEMGTVASVIEGASTLKRKEDEEPEDRNRLSPILSKEEKELSWLKLVADYTGVFDAEQSYCTSPSLRA